MSRAAFRILALGMLAGCGSAPAEPPRTVAGPAAVERAGGHEQQGLTQVPLRDSLVVRVLDEEGRPVADAMVDWSAEGGDSIRPARSPTDGNGMARALVILGPEPGPRTILAVVDSLEAAFSAEGSAAEPGEVHEGRLGYIRYEPGELPLIVSAGHGGTMEPSEIPDRTAGTTVRDVNTDLLARAMADSIAARFGARPHLVLSALHRRKLDPNRELEEAAQGNARAEHAWREYHGFLEHAKERLRTSAGAGFYLDIHGHGHPIERLELGYLLTGADLARPDAELDVSFAARSSIRTLAESSPHSFSHLLRGELSLGSMFEEAGVPAVPSAEQPDPGNDPFFSGGYSTWRHGSRDGGTVSGVQIEAHRPGLRDTAENRARFAGIAAAVLGRYLAAHYDLAPAAAGTP